MQGSKLFVGNLSYSTTENELQELFSQHGSVKSVKIIANKGFGFVEMSTPEEAEAAMGALNLTHFGGRNISVSEARPEKKHSDRGFGGRSSGGRGGFGGRDSDNGGYRRY